MTDSPAEQDAIRALIADTYAAMSSRKPGTARFFAHPDIAIAGSGQGELVAGPEQAARMADGVTNSATDGRRTTSPSGYVATLPGRRSWER